MYASFLAAAFFLYFSYNDHWHYYFPNLGLTIEQVKVLYNVFGTVAYICALDFVRRFCQVSIYSASLNRKLLLLRHLLTVFAVLLILLPGQMLVISLANLFWFITAIVIVLAVGYIKTKGSRYATYILVGWVPFVVVAIDMLLVSLGAKFGGIDNFIAFFAAILFEIIIFQFALADMALSYREERDRALDLACRDALTKTYNRHGLQELLPSKLSTTAMNGQSLFIAMLDLDHFKQINDNYGHDLGDACLKQVAFEINSLLRKEDIIVRFGGEEFLLIFESRYFDDVQDICLRILHKLRTSPFTFSDTQLTLTASIGLAEYRLEDTLDSNIKTVDQALYQSKLKGRDTLTVA